MNLSNSLNVFISALGQKHPSEKILDAIVEIGEGFVESKSPLDNDYYFQFFTKGVSFNFSDDRLKMIVLYLKKEGMYSEFSGKIFEEQTKEIYHSDVISFFDKPYIAGGGETSTLLGYIKPWIKYNFLTFSIMFDFIGKGKKLATIYLFSENNYQTKTP